MAVEHKDDTQPITNKLKQEGENVDNPVSYPNPSYTNHYHLHLIYLFISFSFINYLVIVSSFYNQCVILSCFIKR